MPATPILQACRASSFVRMPFRMTGSFVMLKHDQRNVVFFVFERIEMQQKIEEIYFDLNSHE